MEIADKKTLSQVLEKGFSMVTTNSRSQSIGPRIRRERLSVLANITQAVSIVRTKIAGILIQANNLMCDASAFYAFLLP